MKDGVRELDEIVINRGKAMDKKTELLGYIKTNKQMNNLYEAQVAELNEVIRAVENNDNESEKRKLLADLEKYLFGVKP